MKRLYPFTIIRYFPLYIRWKMIKMIKITLKRRRSFDLFWLLFLFCLIFPFHPTFLRTFNLLKDVGMVRYCAAFGRFNSDGLASSNLLTARNRFLAKIANNNCMNSHGDRISTSAKLQFYLRNKKSLPKKHSAILSTVSLLSTVEIIIIERILKQKISLQNTFCTFNRVSTSLFRFS